MHRKSKLVALLGILLVAFPALTVSATDAPGDHSISDMSTHPSRGPVTVVEGSVAKLRRDDNGITAVIRTHDLQFMHAVTFWLAVINRPDLCETRPCSGNDLLNRTDIVEGNVVYSGGRVVRSHTSDFMTYVPVGEISGGWFDTPFTNPRGAEVWMVLNDHGPIIPGLAMEMTRTYRAGCTDESIPPPFPATAIADGTLGPNACQLYQSVIFQ